jgi:ketosteroid isomerase-like protein
MTRERVMAAEVVQEVFAALGRSDMPAVHRLLAENLVMTLAGQSRFAGRHVGREKVLGLLGELSRGLSISNEPKGIYDGAGGAVVHQTGSAPGYADESLLLFKVADGRVYEVVEFLFDVPAFDAFVARAEQKST